MTPEIILVLIVLVVAILMFIFEWVRVDVVGIIMMVVLPLLGLVTPKEAISGLSSNAVVSIIAVIILGAGLDKTGAMNSLARIILKFAGKSESSLRHGELAGRPVSQFPVFSCPWAIVLSSAAVLP